MPVLLDTHAWVWAIDRTPRLSSHARLFIELADLVLVSPISLYEICQKVRLGKWPEMSAHVDKLQGFLTEQGISLAPLSGEIAARGGLLDWNHRDPFDRLIAATSLEMDWPLVSADTAFDEVPGLRRIW